jgi:hypothetical protein
MTQVIERVRFSVVTDNPGRTYVKGNVAPIDNVRVAGGRERVLPRRQAARLWVGPHSRSDARRAAPAR